MVQYQVELTDLRRKLAEMNSTFTAAFPEVKGLQAQIQKLEEAMKNESSKTVGRIRNEFHAAQRREELLEADYGNQAQLVSEQARKSIQYQILKRDVESIRDLYENLQQKGKEARVASAMSASHIRVVDPATPPDRPFKPNHYTNTALGLLTGMFLGVVLIVMREQLDRTR